MPSSATRAWNGRKAARKAFGLRASSDRIDEPLDRLFVGLVRAQPAGVHLRLAQRLHHVRADPFPEDGLGLVAARTATRRRASDRADTPRSRPGRGRAVQLGLEPAVQRRATRMTSRFPRARQSPTARSGAPGRPRRAWCRASPSPTAPAGQLPLPLDHPVVDRRRVETERSSDRRRPRSATAGGCRCTARCPRCPWPPPGW